MANLIPLSNSSIIKSNKTSAIVSANKLLSSKTAKTTRNKRTNPTEDIIKQIEKKVIKIDKILKNFLAFTKKQNEVSRVKKEQKEFGEREKELEKKTS